MCGDGIGPTRTRFLTPDMCRIHLGNLGALHVTVLNEDIYGGVYAAYAFPVAYPGGYISLLQSVGEQEVEIGIIRDLDEFPPEAQELVRQALARRYFIHTITAIREIGWKYGLVAFERRDRQGTVEFLHALVAGSRRGLRPARQGADQPRKQPLPDPRPRSAHARRADGIPAVHILVILFTSS